MNRNDGKRKHGARRVFGGLSIRGAVASLWALARRGRKSIVARVKRVEADEFERTAPVVNTEATAPQPSAPVASVADEKTMRAIAEAQAGGVSSRESAERYARGENPGGLHHKATRELDLEDAEEAAFEAEDDVHERRLRRPGRTRAMAAHRKGA